MCDTGCDTNRNTDIDEKNIASRPDSEGSYHFY